METNKVLSALCYFSIFFAGFLFPLIVYFVSDNPHVKKDAKSAFLSHLLPVIAVPLVFAGLVMDMGVFASGAGLPVFTVIMIGLAIILSVVVVIWNVYKGIKVLL
ncbi:DUF4870 domain-containing protein [Rossellomorea vietnamensis]|uniref:DUF4870 domain-containing protein n=1 Tax=Rossellomorea vietnamensis TaxID=218284 RepID=UPI001E28C031|nr:DUF4870 domain-containing protein [Rossellomorea vietnamensis]MCC5802097.1 DUF4870 domain-containing protein [Rossellomorea vietnamensis]